MEGERGGRGRREDPWGRKEWSTSAVEETDFNIKITSLQWLSILIIIFIIFIIQSSLILILILTLIAIIIILLTCTSFYLQFKTAWGVDDMIMLEKGTEKGFPSTFRTCNRVDRRIAKTGVRVKMYWKGSRWTVDCAHPFLFLRGDPVSMW